MIRLVTVVAEQQIAIVLRFLANLLITSIPVPHLTTIIRVYEVALRKNTRHIHLLLRRRFGQERVVLQQGEVLQRFHKHLRVNHFGGKIQSAGTLRADRKSDRNRIYRSALHFPPCPIRSASGERRRILPRDTPSIRSIS